MNIHYGDNYLYNDRHPITINVVGVGGNGTHVLYNLAKINLALLEMGKPGIHVKAYDNDKVEEHNLLRQSFSYQDIGEYKASIIINRINRFYGFGWESINDLFKKTSKKANITIGCVDTIKSRKIIHDNFKQDASYFVATDKPLYYLDIGNDSNYSQFILGSNNIKQPKTSKYKTINKLKTFNEEFKDFSFTDKNEPSCSAFQSLMNQGLFTNNLISTQACNLLWELLFNKFISTRGAFMNNKEFKMKPLIV
jgi:PRTRC genetic system ThiF family protein